MKFSIQDDDISKLIVLEEEVSDKITEQCQSFVDNITNWGKKFNSQLVLDISKKTIGIIDDDLHSTYVDFVKQLDETGGSFTNIGERYRIGDEALQKVKNIQEKITGKMCEPRNLEISYVCNGEAMYSTELIKEYDTLINSFLSNIQADSEAHLAKARTLCDDNILANTIEMLVRFQYDTLIKIANMYHMIFDAFLEWYERTVKENEHLLNELVKQIERNNESGRDEEIEKVLAQILDESSMGGSSASSGIANQMAGSSNQQGNKSSSENAEKSIKKALNSSVNDFAKELDTVEKIQNLKNYVQECETQFADCKNESDEVKRQSKFQKVCEFLKKGAKKYAKPIAKALGIIVPLIAPEGALVAKIAAALPSVMECFSGELDEKKDMDKVELGLDCIKSIGLQNLPNEPEKINQYIEERSKEIAEDILKKILSSDKYLKVLNIDESELSKPQNRAVYKKYTGKELASVPQKKAAYDYDFERYEPQKLNQLKPRVDEEKVSALSSDLWKGLSGRFRSNNFDKAMSEIESLKKELDLSKAYVDVPESSDIMKIIEEIRSILKAKTKEEFLNDHDGRFNKDEIRLLVDEFEAEKVRSEKNKRVPDYSNACSNFLRRHMGYPSKEEDTVIVKNAKELIPVINSNCPRFRVENDDLLDMINKAQNLTTQKNGKIKKKGILTALWDNATILGGTLGIGALLAIGGCWPLGMLYAWTTIGCALADSQSSAYTSLVYQLGDKRVDILLENYQNIEENLFALNS